MRWLVETVAAMHPFYVIRAMGGVLFLIGGLMLAAILVAIVVTLIPLLRRRDGQPDEMYDKK